MVRGFRFRSFTTLGTLGLVLSVRAVCAATVDVVARDNQGAPLHDVGVALMPIDPPPFRSVGKIGDYVVGESVAHGMSDTDGRLTLQAVPPGRYVVTAARFRSSFLISPMDDRFFSPPVVTVRQDSDRLAVEVVYVRGDRVILEAWLNNNPFAYGQVSFLEGATRREVRQVLDKQGYQEIVLPPGRWEVSIVPPPPGFLLLSLEKDHAPLPGASATIQVVEGSNVTRLVWRYGSSCLVRGHLTWNGAGPPPAQIVATLVQAGSWREAAEERGGSAFQRVERRVDEGGRYEMPLLDGLWRLEAVGPRLLSRSPESVSLELAPEDERTVDFQVTVAGDDEESALTVIVLDPSGRALADAVVAVRPLGESAGTSDPQRRTKTEGSYKPSATFRGLAKGSYRIAATHLEYTEGTVDLPEFEGKAGDEVVKTVTLGAGAVLRAHAIDAAQRNAEGVDVIVERVGAPAPSLVNDPDLAEKRARRRGRTDRSGWAAIGGLDAGTYRIRAELAGPLAQTHVARLVDGAGRPADDMEVSLAENEKREVEVRLVAMGSIRARLRCTDREPIPKASDFRVLPSPLGSEDPEPEDGEIARLAAVSREGVLLSGESLDTLTAGPLEASPFVLAVRPAGHDRWTYEGDTEEIARAIPVTVEEGKTADGGFVEIDCGPTIRLRPEIGTKDPLPDLREARVLATLVRLPKKGSPQSPGRDETRGLPVSAVDRSRKKITLRRVPEEKVRVEGTVSHPFFVPETVPLAPAVLTLVRGRESEIVVPVPEIGGVLEIDADGSPAAIVTDGERRERRAETASGIVRFAGLRRGAYSARLCVDAACGRAARTWTDVAVLPAEVTRLR